jgi:hypothetical protein
MFRLGDTKRCYVRFTGISGAGNEAPLEGVVLGSSNPDLMVAGQDDVGLYFEAVGPLGTAQLQIQADAAPGADVAMIYGTEDIEIVPSQAVSVRAQFGEVVDKPVAPPVEPPTPPESGQG